MSITDELRKWWVRKFPVMDKELHKEFTAIADRIDAAVKGMVELPKDADEVPWNVGDRDEDGNEVIALKLATDGWYVVTVGEWPYRPEHKRHYHAPTVEDVLREFTDAILEWAGKSGTVAEVGTWSDVAAEYAAKLRLAEGEDA